MKYLTITILLVIGAIVGVINSAPTDKSLKQTNKQLEKLQKSLNEALDSKLKSAEQDYRKAQEVDRNQESKKILAQIVSYVDRKDRTHAKEQFENLFSSGPIYIDAKDKHTGHAHTQPWMKFIKKMIASSSG